MLKQVTLFAMKRKTLFLASQKTVVFKVTDGSLLILHEQNMTVKPQGETVYLNDCLVEKTTIVAIEDGMTVLTPSFYLEKRQDQWRN